MPRLFNWVIGILLPMGIASSSVAIEYTPIQPPSYPLAVRNPYLSTWLPGDQVAKLPSCQPQFWFGNNLGWSVMANVDKQTYNLFGVTAGWGSKMSSMANPDIRVAKSHLVSGILSGKLHLIGVTNPAASTKSAVVTNASFTSTHSIFTVTAGHVEFAIDFFSPVSSQNYVRQSLPFSYLSVTTTPKDGKAHDVDIYSDIDESWTGDKAKLCSSSVINGTHLYEFSADGPTFSQSKSEIALWAKVVFAAHQETYSVSSTSGSAKVSRALFQATGNVTSSSTGSDDCKVGGSYGFAYRLGQVQQSTTVRYVVGVVREEAVNYLDAPQTHYYRSVYPDIPSAVSHFFDDYDAAYNESLALDSSIETTASSLVGTNYSDILALSTRQVMGGIDLTIPADTLNTTELRAFIKEISSDGNMNTVDIIFPAFPFFYVYAPEYIKLLLDPVLEYLASGCYPNPWVVHDIGANYPNATGHDLGKDERMPIEETGNLFILIDAYEKATGDKTWAAQYSDLWPGYAEYLAHNGLYPEHQLSTTDGLGAFTNMTSLAIKAAVGLSAYASISGQKEYAELAQQFATTILTPGVGIAKIDKTKQSYLDLTYGAKNWYLTFNLFPQALLNLSAFPSSLFTSQSAFYPTVRSSSGVAISSTATWGKTDWDFWVAATSEEATRNMFVNDIWAYISNKKNTLPFSDRYFVKGTKEGLGEFRARPTVGAHWAIWALALGPNSG
ncbi:DUF1793-domain-containing protein [Aureobasidium subglaciale]|nr:DUF1793-domain-containing protein [Aureobasidium subglaciale]